MLPIVLQLPLLWQRFLPVSQQQQSVSVKKHLLLCITLKQMFKVAEVSYRNANYKADITKCGQEEQLLSTMASVWFLSQMKSILFTSMLHIQIDLVGEEFKFE